MNLSRVFLLSGYPSPRYLVCFCDSAFSSARKHNFQWSYFVIYVTVLLTAFVRLGADQRCIIGYHVYNLRAVAIVQNDMLTKMHYLFN